MSATTFTFGIPYAQDYGGYYRLRSCNTNLTGSTPADQYQRLRLIQRTVRVPTSLYIMAKGALSAYKQPTVETHNVCWNQQSDRPVPSVAKQLVPTGGGSSSAVAFKGGFVGYAGRSYTQTCSRPGGQAPGGIGVDIKHNSYARHLNRLKAKAPLKQQGVPVDFAGQLPFNQAYPIYGGKTMKTGLVAGCNCAGEDLRSLYLGTNEGPIFDNMSVALNVGDSVYALYPGNTSCYTAAVIVSITDGVFEIQFGDGTIVDRVFEELRVYYTCGTSSSSSTTSIFKEEFLNDIDNVFNENCIYPNNPYLQALFQ